jgi:glycosyltransferase involved in cell wall biosynthesis
MSGSKIAVAICTHNRASSLERTLESLVNQSGINDIDWELLLIDNNSSDTTPEVAERFTDRLPLRYVFEGTQGLSAARNRALKEFSGELLVFTDDDVVLDQHWLAAYFRAAKEFPGAAYFGGRILPLWEGNRPSWLKEPSLSLISGLLGNYDLGEDDRWFKPEDLFPFGANFAIRGQLIKQLQPFRLDLGVSGESLGRGEEAEYLQRAQLCGARGMYLSTAVCHHAQLNSRFRISHLFRYGFEKGRAEVLIGEDAQASRLKQLEFALRGLWQLLKGRGDRFRQCVINMGIQEGILRSRSAVK